VLRVIRKINGKTLKAGKFGNIDEETVNVAIYLEELTEKSTK
jgi:hypothetical protein